MAQVLMHTVRHRYDRNHMAASFTQLHQELAELLPADLRAACVTSRYAKGEQLFSAGQKPTYMFFISSGEVLLERLSRQGEAIVLQRTRHGIVSEASLQSARYHCDAKVIASSEITGVPIHRIAAALASDPAFSSRWIGMLNREVKRLRLQCERLSLHKVQDRLLHFLETEGQQGKYPLSSGLKSLAGELGVTHEALYRCVSDLEKKGILRRGDGYLITLSR
ncbi:MAG: Crp/Fnr family transcriptional regulator [Rhodoferax sp.]|uniref:Crp/Fnr family transcriptional regulator n=1 Tax=Rhodoferax sp. TaxID=50421 RepID=UPI0026166AEE|nr:Crp/Fnr family transcriptional regulator [Rhodoferax sp.]MDD5334275.1 Crp/Fnr family transcriptional regulator [Rhodoferax sp.]